MLVPNESLLLPRRIWLRGEPLRFVLVAGSLMVVAYTALYFPYPDGSLPVRILTGYLHLVARLSAAGASMFDRSVAARDDMVQGRVELRIVLDCAALDAHALLAAAVLAFPTTWAKRLLGVVTGTVVLAIMNVGRIVALYGIALHWPAAFYVAHEEVFQFGIVLVAFLVFWGWTAWARQPSRG